MKKYKYIKLGIASPEEIRSWSYGEVKKHETINYRTQKPERDGLFCEIIFGPTRDYQCSCGKSKRGSNREKRCDRCGVDITESLVRRERMGHIELAAPVVHTWYFKNMPSKVALLLDMKAKVVEDIVYLASYIVTDPGSIEELEKGRILTEQENSLYQIKYGSRSFKALTGAEAIKHLLQELDLPQIRDDLRSELDTKSKLRRQRIVRRLQVVEDFINSGNKPEWMVMDVIPVLPPDLRPMVQLDGGRFATTDLNDLYRRILNRNARLKKQFEQRAPNLITKNEKRMLQEAMDALIDNGRRNRKPVMERNRPLKSLSDLLRGKQGRFRQNLLGKRVDYSGRSVIVVGPELQMYQCGIPREMALILFKPFIIKALINRKLGEHEPSSNKISIKKAKEMIEAGDPLAMTKLEEIVVEHPVLLNRAPTLHRLGIQAFEPKLVEGKAIQLHPLVCPAFNADFDGDQMAVHVPLSEEAQAEARVLMLASKNILAPKDGKPIVTPSQDMVLGNYYLTISKENQPNEGKIFQSVLALELAYENDEIDLHTRILIPVKALDYYTFNEKHHNKLLATTYGKILFNTIFPEGFNYLNEPESGNLTEEMPDKYFLDLRGEMREVYDKVLSKITFDSNKEMNERVAAEKNKVIENFFNNLPTPRPFGKGFLSSIISEIFKKYGLAETSIALDKMKNLGFKYSTIGGITVSAFDLRDVPIKEEVVKKGDMQIEQINEAYELGMTSYQERHSNIVDVWTKAKNDIEHEIRKDIAENYKENHIYMMVDSGARGNIGNFVQLQGMRGLMAKPSGEIMEVPIKASFKEGLTSSEFFISTHGARKGSTDTALKTAESGYLTRRLVDVAQDVIVSENECGTDKGLLINLESTASDKDKHEQKRIIGRYVAKPILHPETNEVLVGKDDLITEILFDKVIAAGVKEATIRTLLTCDTRSGVCVKCYGSDLSTGQTVERGEVVGIIAAQSIGEPGTQLTMRTFHLGGVAGDDITQGLPRIQELFEARNPKIGKSIISEIHGEVVDIEPLEDDNEGRTKITVRNRIESIDYLTDAGVMPIVTVGTKVEPGDRLVAGTISPKELLRVSTTEKVQRYILDEVQAVYLSQGVGIADKHIEIIIRQMMQKVTVVNEGDTKYLPGEVISKDELYDVVQDCLAKKKTPPVAKPLLLGITAASLRSDSFLSAASFQETTRVLTDASIAGKVDNLLGLKENVIIGGLIPAGTGLVGDVSLEYEDELDQSEEA